MARQFFVATIVPAALAAAALGLVIVPAAAKPAKRAAAAGQMMAPAGLDQVLADPRRNADSARDQYRHPAQTLAFFRVQPGMTVVDYMPTGGWWTRVLVPLLGPQGHYIGLNPDVTKASDGMKKSYADMAATFPAKAAGWTGVSADAIGAYNTDTMPTALYGTVDRVLIFREMHNLWRTGMLYRELSAVRALLKPDGLLGIEQHRARPGTSADYTDGNKGYLRERDVIALVEAHGFELVAKSEINANPRDPANHPGGVWMLPPVFSAGDKDRARFAAIGESDRMTLLFRKRP